MSTNKFTTNNNPTLVAVSNADGETPVYLYADPTTHGLISTPTGSLVPESYDYIAYTNTDTTTDTYVYKTGGASGTTVATLTIVFTDTTKTQPSTITRT